MICQCVKAGEYDQHANATEWFAVPSHLTFLLMLPLLIRADASAKIGTGHVMRMIALAQAWQRRGGQVHLASFSMPELLLPRLHAEKIKVHTLAASIASGEPSCGDASDGQRTAELADRLGARWVVADGYRFATGFQSEIRRAGLLLAVVTDFEHCENWQCDLILNQNPHSVHETYACTVSSCRRLMGTQYVLLRREFLADWIDDREVTGQPAIDGQPGSVAQPPMADEPKRVPDRRQRLLITLGGSDVDNITGRVLRLIEEAGCDSMDIRVLVGAANPHQPLLRRETAGSSHSIVLLGNVTDMPQQYQWADGIVSAAGSSCFEWMYYGLRAAIVAIADNQLPIYRELTRDNIAIGMGMVAGLTVPPAAESDALGFDALGFDTLDFDTVARTSLTRFIRELDAGRLSVERFRHLVDGHGADRLAAELDTGIWLRPATSHDRERYFQWANDPIVRQNSLCDDEIKWTGHCEWFARQLASHRVHLLVAIRNDQPVGQIRFTSRETNDWEVAFSVAPEARGSGVGKQLLQLGTAWMTDRGCGPLTATVKATNRASARCFERLGWQGMPSKESELLRFRMAV